MVKEMFYDVQPTPNTRIYELERRVGNLEEALHFWINDFKQKLDIKTVQISILGDKHGCTRTTISHDDERSC